jgi:NAD(P)-dependent dehydrogenase (short-subunit alcohol dehydrogenase family)
MPVAIVTGCSQGIGRAIAIRLVEDGYSVALNDLEFKRPALEALAAELTERSKTVTKASRAPWANGKATIDYKTGKVVSTDDIAEQKIVAVTADISNEDSVKNMIEEVVELLGSVDVVCPFRLNRGSSSSHTLQMVANAGLYLNGTVLDTTVSDFDRLFNINVKGVYLCYKYAAEQMIKQGRGGRLIAASSLAGIVAEDGMFAYGASKFAVRGLNQSAARYLGKYGITANTYSPGAILTEMRKHLSSFITSQLGLTGACSQRSHTSPTRWVIRFWGQRADFTTEEARAS